MVFIKARASAPKTVIYTDDHGAETVREGGSRAWRNFNPGNIQKGSFAEANGSIGGDTRFALFPSEAVGLDAVVALLQSPSYSSLTLEKAINRYAPPSENNTAGYVKFVSDRTGIARSAVLSTLKAAELRAIAKAIQFIEGWTAGKEYPNNSMVALSGVSPLIVPVSSAAVAAEDWMAVARDEAARPEKDRTEWPDPGENPRILRYFERATPGFDEWKTKGDEVDWCAAFVNYCLESAGYRGTGHPGARSIYWNANQQFIPLQQPQYGAIAVFRDKPFTDPKWKTGTGHVAFVVNWNADEVEVLGGNQSNTVRVQTFPKVKKSGNIVTRKVVAYMMPVMN